MHALKVLEYGAVLERLRFHCEMTIAADASASLKPKWRADEVWDALSITSEAYDALSKDSPPRLAAIRDVREALNRASKGGVLGGQELFMIGEALGAMRSLRTFLIAKRQEMPRLYPYAESLPEAKRIEEQLLDSLEPDGSVKDDASPALSSLRQRKKTAAARIQERIQSYISKSRDLLSDPIYTIRDGRYVIPLKAENRGKIRGIVHDSSASGQTIYLEPEDVLQLGNSLREIEAQERAEIQRILTALSSKVGSIAVSAIAGIEAAAQIDLVFAKARLAFEMKGTLPQKVAGPAFIQVQGGRHPLLDKDIVVPLDIVLGKGNSVLITGPNTGGKTVAIKCVGLFVLMAQSGLLLPALDVKLGPFSQVWADIGDEQSLQQSLSTFSGHIRNIAESLKDLKENSLVLLDEIGAGTDPAEGAALATAVLTEMTRRGATVLASTHYGELKAFAYNNEGFQNAAMEFDQKSLRPTYRLMMGAPGASHALRIAERYGIPKAVVQQAKESLGEQQQDVAVMLEQLEQSQRQARQAQGEADRRAAELKKAEERAARKLAEADEIRKNVHSRAAEAIEAALREIRLEASNLFEELKKSPSDPKVQERVRKSLRDLQDVGHDFAQEFAPKPKTRVGLDKNLKKGATVQIDGFTQIGTLLDDPKGRTVRVQIGSVKMEVPVASVEPAKASPSSLSKPRSNIQLHKAMTATTEIHLRHMRAEDALRDLERFLDDAVLAGLPSIRIVHGKGEGILRKVTQDYLRKNPNVASFREGDPAEGGQGVTIATMR